MKNLTILSILAVFAIGCHVETTSDTPATDSCQTVLVPDTAPDSIQKTQYPDSGCLVSADTIK